MYISRPHQLFKYKKGIYPRLKDLSQKYFLRSVPWVDGDIFIDVGANIGEVTVALREIVCPGTNLNSISIEPDELEFDCLRPNLNSDDLAFRWFISDSVQDAFANFNNDSGDTRLLLADEMRNCSQKIQVSSVQTTSLDNLILNELEFEVIRLLKVEVEGMEPEVLSGAQKLLKQTEFVTIDCGPERNGVDTFDDCNRIMEANGFELLQSHGRDSALYRNKSFPAFN